MTAKAKRLRRIFQEDGRAFVVPIDHAVTSGPIAGIESPRSTIAAMVESGVDAMIVHRGVVTGGAWPIDSDAGLIVHLSAGTELSGSPELKSAVCAVEDAVKLGADAVSVHVSLGTGHDSEALSRLGATAGACQEWGMPLLAMMYAYGEAARGRTSTAHLARIGAELGADCVKVDQPDDREQLDALLSGCFCPVMVAGGRRVDDDRRVLSRVEAALTAGAAGACVGRNAYQHPRPSRFAKALGDVVHGRRSADEALGELASPDGATGARRDPEPHLV